MKRGFFLLVLISFSLLWNSCKKNDDDNSGNPGFRVTAATFWLNDKLDSKMEYIYEDEKLKTIQYYVFVNPDWVLTNKEEYNYPSEEMSSYIHYYNLGSKTWKEEYKIECYNNNGKITKWIQYHHELGDWTAEFEEELVYNDAGSLGEWKEYDYSTGSRVLIYREVYSYNGQQISTTEVYQRAESEVALFAKLDLTYETGILKNILVSIKEPASWRENSRMDISYLNNDLMSAGLSFKENGHWIQYNSWSYNYDEFGNLSGELKDDIFHHDVERTEYTYENKSGNVNDFNPPVNWVFDGLWRPQVTKSVRPVFNVNWQLPGTFSR